MPEPETQNRITTNGAALNQEQQLAVLSELVSRIDFARQHGMQYGGERDIYAVGGYKRDLIYGDFKDLYDRDPVAGAIVDMLAEATWRAAPEVGEPDSGGDTAFSRDFMATAKRLGLWARMERLDKLSRIGRYGVMLIGTPDATDQNLRSEMANLRGPDDVLYLAVYSEKYAKINTWVEDSEDPRYGLPETYKIHLAGDVSTFRKRAANQTEVVHHSRVIHVAEGLLEDDVYGKEALRNVWNPLHDLQKVSTSTAEGFWQRVAGILHAQIDPDVHVDEKMLEALDDNLQKVYHDLKRTIYGNFDLKRLAESEPDPKEAANLYMTLIAAGSGIPKRLLFGSETGERASTEDQKTFLGRISERHNQHAEPNMLRPLVDRLIEKRGLSRPRGDEYEVVWPTLFKEPDLDIAEANLSRARAAKELTPLGGDPLALIEVDPDRNVWLVPRKVDDESPFEMQPPEDDPGPPEAREGEELEAPDE